MEKRSEVLKAIKKMLGIVENSNHVCVCGEQLILGGIESNNFHNSQRATLVCPNGDEGIHTTLTFTYCRKSKAESVLHGSDGTDTCMEPNYKLRV